LRDDFIGCWKDGVYPGKGRICVGKICAIYKRCILMSLLKNADTVTFRKTEQSQIKTLVQRLEITNKNTDSCKYQWIDK
jgi:hypothetical protein